MRLSKSEINDFMMLLKVTEPWDKPSIPLLNEIVKEFTVNMPWQNLSMILNGIGKIPDLLDIKYRMLHKIGGICLDNNRFVYHLLSELGFNVSYILCRRPSSERTHLALIVEMDDHLYFVDCGDAQPYFEAFDIASREVITGRSIDYKVQFNNGYYQLLRKRKKEWKVYYEFDLTKVDKVELDTLIQKYYSDVFFGPFWKAVHFACYPDEKLIAVKDHTILIEQDDGHVKEIHYSSFDIPLDNLKEKLPEKVLNQFNFPEAFEKLREVNLLERFGLELTSVQTKLFLKKLEIRPESNSLYFINRLINSVIANIPFQNQTMLSRDFGVIPKSENIIKDMVTLRGGTCGTMNIFFGALLFSLGYDSCLIQGTMRKDDDHIGVLLTLNNEKYVIDIGDGQPFFQAFSCTKNIQISTPFRTYRTIVQDSLLTIQFLIKDEWVTDSVFNLEPRSFEEIKRTLICHYSDSEFGPFWKGVRFAMYPNKKMIAIRDRMFYRELSDHSIERIEIRNMNELENILTKYLPSYKESIVESFHKLRLL